MCLYQKNLDKGLQPLSANLSNCSLQILGKQLNQSWTGFDTTWSQFFCNVISERVHYYNIIIPSQVIHPYCQVILKHVKINYVLTFGDILHNKTSTQIRTEVQDNLLLQLCSSMALNVYFLSQLSYNIA